MFCPHCGTKNEDAGARFCGSCGAPFLTQDQTSANTSPGVTARPDVPAYYVKVKNTLVWVVAFMPLISVFIEYLLAGTIYKNAFVATLAVRSGKLWWVSLIVIGLNIGLCYCDENKLKKLGIDTSSFGQAWLIPVYLWRRAKALGHNQAYTIVWGVLFCLSILGVFG